MLDEILAWRNLSMAWEQVADNRGGPGPDRVSIKRFTRHWEENLRRIQELVMTGRYRTGRLRRVAIPKRGGGERLISIANVGDRVLQRATLNVLDPIYEGQFLTCSYGYRRGRSLRDAVAHILQLRNQGLVWLLDADIDDCFHSLGHAPLLQWLGRDICDERVLRLIHQWLFVGRFYTNPERGIAMGMPISPLLCNLYLHQMDQQLIQRGWALVRYADDFIICCHSEAEAELAYQEVEAILAQIGLSLKAEKTSVTSFAQGFDYLGVHFEGRRYSFLWKDKRMTVDGPTPAWVWGYVPRGYVG